MKISKARKLIFCIQFLINLLFVKIFIVIKGFNLFLKMLEKSSSSRKKNNVLNTNSANELIKLAKRISSVFQIDSCLIIVSAIYITFNNSGIKSDYFIGVRLSSEKSFESHAWISINNYIFDEDARNINSFKIIKALNT